VSEDSAGHLLAEGQRHRAGGQAGNDETGHQEVAASPPLCPTGVAVMAVAAPPGTGTSAPPGERQIGGMAMRRPVIDTGRTRMEGAFAPGAPGYTRTPGRG